MKSQALLCFAMTALITWTVCGQVVWTPIPKSDPANQLLELIRASQPSPSDLPENSTYNYIWAQHMMAWMVAERSGLMTAEERDARLSGFLNRVSRWQTYHGFYYDSYDAATGTPTSDNVYFQGWWIWALILAEHSCPAAAPAASTILSRLDFDAAGMVSPDHKFLAADRNAATGAISYYIKPTGDIAGELRTALVCYTWLTGDITPWKITGPPSFINVGGQSVLSVFHHFTFDPFYVHACFPETGYFQQSYQNLVVGAKAYRLANQMRFYATRMEPLEAWTSKPEVWPNTEHRVSKPWTAWLTDPSAFVMDSAWIPGYGLAQYFDNWNFYWGYGTVAAAHEKVIGGEHHGAFEAGFQLETLGPGLATKPPRLTKLMLQVKSAAQAEPLIIKINGIEFGRVDASASLTTPVTVMAPAVAPSLEARNIIRLETTGTGLWQIGATPTTYHYVKWLDDDHAAANVPAICLTIFVDGQRPARENPFAFLCRAAGAFGNFPWMLLVDPTGSLPGRHLVTWTGDFTTDVRYAHVIYNVEPTPKAITYWLSPWERAQQWAVLDYDRRTNVSSARNGDLIRWTQNGRQAVFLKVNSP